MLKSVMMRAELGQLSPSPPHAFSRAALCCCTGGEGQKYFCTDEMLQIQLEKQKCRRGLDVAAKGLGVSFRNAFVYAGLTISRHSSVLFFPCHRDGGIPRLEERALAHLMLGRAWSLSVEVSYGAKPALLPATWVQSSAVPGSQAGSFAFLQDEVRSPFLSQQPRTASKEGPCSVTPTGRDPEVSLGRSFMPQVF